MSHAENLGSSAYTVSSGTSPDPTGLFRSWLNAALAARPQAHAMGLATATPDGRPSLRTVMLQAYGAAGFVFLTERDTVKARQLAANPHAALLFFWPEANRQIRIDGTARRLSSASLAWSRFSPLTGADELTWISSEGLIADSRQAMAALMTGVCGFIVDPGSVRFWQGGQDRQHAVVEYTRAAEGWARRISGPPDLRHAIGIEADS